MSPSATPTSRPAKRGQKNAATKPSTKKTAVSKQSSAPKTTKDVKKPERKIVTKMVKEAAPKKAVKTKELKDVQSKTEKTKSVEKEKKTKHLSAPEPEVKKTAKASAHKEPKVAHEDMPKPVEIKAPKEEKKERKTKAKAEPPMDEVFEMPAPPIDELDDDAPKKRGRKKKVVEDMPFEDFDEDKPTRGKRAGGTRHIVDEFLDPEPLLEEDDMISPDELDPLELPLELLDPELVEVPRPASSHPTPKPKVPKGDRRLQKCTSCGGMFGWLSVDQQCFTCLKKAIAKRKRDDESYSDFPTDNDSDDEES